MNPSTSGGSSLEPRISGLAREGLSLLVLLIVVILASAVLVTVDSNRAIAGRNSEIAAGNLVARMADQQTGLLTYLKPTLPDSPFLYTEGRQQTERSLEELRVGTPARQTPVLRRDWKRRSRTDSGGRTTGAAGPLQLSARSRTRP